MNNVIYAATFVATLVAASTALEYYISRKRGHSRETSVHECTLAGIFLSGSAVLSYIVTFA